MGIKKYKYVYNYRKRADISFMYDNAPDPRAIELKSYLHHMHKKDDELIESGEVTLSDVLEDIERTFIK